MSDKQGAPNLPPLTGGGGNNGGSNAGAPQQQQQQQQQTVSMQHVFANVLTSGNVQQFVLTSQVPGLTQVLPSGGTTSQPIGVTRFVNIAGTSPRVSVVNVPSGAASSAGTGTTLTSPSRQNPKLVLTTSPKLVRTSIANMLVTPSTQVATGQSPPAKKKLRLADSTEKPTSVEVDGMSYRRRIMEHKLKRMRAIRDKYNENATELFFLQIGGNLMDYYAWKKRPPIEYLQFIKEQKLEADSEEEELLRCSDPGAAIANMTNTALKTTATVTTNSTAPTTTTSQRSEIAVSGGTPVAVSTTLPPAVAQLNQQGGTPIVIDSSKSNSTTGNPVAEKVPGNNPVDKPSAPPVSSNQPIVKLVKLPASTIASSCDTVNSNQEQIVEKAKQEAYVMQRIAELQREGLWSEKRLPKVQEPPRPKAHWDYLLEEMLWLSTDFAQERKWKKSAAKKCARMVQKYFQEKALQAQKAEKLEELRLKKIASFIAKEVKTFWANVEKVVEYKQQTRLEEKRKKALDQQLNFIVDQTEKYSSWLTEGMNKTEGNLSTPASIHSSRIASPVTIEKHSDDDFKPNQCSDDDEETIAKAEEEMKSNHKEEIELLKKESELPLEELLPNYLENRDNSLSPLPIEIVEEESDCVESKDTEFTVASDESSEDEEDTIQEQEKLEKDVDHQKELDELQAENEMSIEELMTKYGNASETPMDIDNNENEESESDTDKEDEEENESESESENESESEDETLDDSQIQSDEDTTVNLKSLLEDLSDENKSSNEASDKQNEMDSVAAIAESIQPKGNTLLTTSVVTKIPFLLKHNLREYQHIGLDWLVTMYDRKLNGILADEMGLGKTIQTIALLAHLACEKGNWGPHLIVVPTSVMLNWEMECKKWCPGFKILTYYGTQKERKQKRTGWTKPNAFHICITSYKLVIQDHQSFRRKKWKYLILDEAQNIKNFKSQRWQLLLNFQTQRRLLLTGTPLQNNLMELWSLMHFLMPNVFQSHREFKEWFSNPVAGMIEGNSEYNENIIRRLHKVLRPFLLRRLKCEVEKQLPKKYEHVIMCRLSKRQRYLYDDFMSRAKTKETLASGNLLSVINVLMQLRKVCNHPNLFESRPTISPFQMEGIQYHTASLAWSALDYNPFKHVDLSCLNLLLVDLEFIITAFVAHRVRQLKTPRKLIEEIDSQPEPPPRCPSGKLQMVVKLSNQPLKPNAATQQSSQQMKIKNFPGILPTSRVGTSSTVKSANNSVASGQGVTLKVASGQQLQGYLQLVQHSGGVKAIPVGSFAQSIQSTTSASPTTAGNAQKLTVTSSNLKDGQQRYATQTYTVKQGDSVQKYQVPIFPQLIQANGKQILIHPNQQNANAFMTSTGQRLTVLSSKSIMGMSPMSVNKMMGGVVASSTAGTSGRPVMRVPPLNVSASQTTGQLQSSPQILRITKNVQIDTEKNQMKETPKSEFYLPQLEEIKRQKRQHKLKTIADMSERRCAVCPLYGEDLRTTVTIRKPIAECPWHNGWLHCISCKEPMRTRRQYFSHAGALAEIIKSTEQIMEELKEVFEKFVVYIPAAQASLPRFHVSHPPPHKLWKEQRSFMELQRHLSPKLSIFHPITSAMSTQFPDTRLIQYDCGKLQSLDYLLRDLKVEGHRVLIFTQMTRMLDVLEAFLNYHGYIYLRLDGATKVDQRQVLMERFNNDKRIFCFILSTRSGGVGVNLTGADTVIFYDSDWNPTMDAQAQDRCHRIGQTRDVHIYRLISERTIEENILKKANQKRLLGDLAIEGGNFTTAYFKSSTIQDLFNVDQTENDASARMAEVLDQSKEREKQQQKESPQTEEKMAIGALESALAAVEEDQDVQAAKTAKAEAVADLAEFDENIPVEDADNDEGVSKAEMEVKNIVSQLTPVERYAMRFVEESDGMFSAAQLAAAERELDEQKKEWELGRLRAMREEEERQMRMTDDDENPLTFSHEDAKNQVWLSENTMELMPMWCPPTPPTSDNDVYIDYSLGFLYDNTPMSEAQLPPVYIKKEPKRSRIDSGSMDRDGHRPVKIRHREELVYAPRSLFKSAQSSNKMRRDVKGHKSRSMPRSPTEREQEPLLEWMIHEDWALLQADQIYQGLCSNSHTPGHTPNWDLVADIVNNTSRIYRSPKQCKARYENYISKRETGKPVFDTTPKKQKKQKGVYKMPHITEHQSKTNQPMRTCQLYNQDKNHSFTAMCNQRFDIIKAVSIKRAPTAKSLLVNPTLKNPKHAAVLKDQGLDYDSPIPPLDLAIKKAERMLKEKSTKGAGPSGMTADQQQARIAQQQQQQIIAQQNQQALTTAQAVTTVAATSAGSGVSAMKTSSVTGCSPTIVSTNVKARAVSALGMQDVRSGTTIVTNLHTAQRLAGANLVATSPNAAALGQKNIIGYTLANKNQLKAHQIQVLKQQQLVRQSVKVHGQATSGQKVAVALSPVAATLAGQQRSTTTLIKPAGAAGSTLGQQQISGKHNLTTRTLTDSEVNALLMKRQLQQAQQQQQNKNVTQAQVPAQAGIAGTQIYTQTGLQVQQPGTVGTVTPVATLVKTAAGTVRTTIPQQQMRQLQLQTQLLAQRKISGQKITQLAQVTGKGMPTQLIVPGKGGTMTVQQLQQVMKSGATVQQFVSTGQAAVQPGQVVFAKSPLPTRVIPVSSGTFKQTIQVVASNAQLRQAVPTQGKPIVTTARASPGPSQVRYHAVTHQQVHAQQQPPQQQQHQPQQQQQQQIPSNPPDSEPK